ncbi:MAG: hypothetical protein A2138_12840 [Deltaproteobacteria bacterium RBG_16_71_12]|nr:MAG: hypothetical protein A2138_12840 [Deltaproteobacteria bacterium RBG_16_71_12]
MTRSRTLPGWLTPRERVALAVVAKRGGWQPGTTGTGFQKLDLMGDVATLRLVRRALTVLGGPTVFDAALIRYPIGSSLPAHVDEATPGCCQVRLQALVIGSGGGLCYLGGEEVPLGDGDAVLFRPDLLKHQLTAVEGNARLVFSVGAEVEAEHARRIELA